MSTAQASRETPDPAPRQDEARGAARRPGQLRSLARAAHPRQALLTALVVGALVALMGRPAREVLVSAAAVLLVQLALGVVDDLSDLDDDRRSGVDGKPLVEGTLPPGNASFAVAVLVLLAVPVSLQVGTVAGLFLLATLPVGLVHHRLLHRTALSWVGWAATYALLTCFVAQGGWAKETDGSAPVTAFVLLAAVLGVLVHVLTTLPDLVEDNTAGVRSLPLLIALRTGATRLLVLAGVGALAVTAALVYTALTSGIAR